LRALGRLDDAAAAYRLALALDPRMVVAHNNLGNALRDHGRLDEAVSAYRAALAIDSAFFPAAANLAITLGKIPSIDRDDLVAAYDRAIEIGTMQGTRDPALATCHNARGNLHLANDALDDAIASYRRAIAIDPRFGQAFLNLGQSLARKLEFEDAIEALRHGLEILPGDVPSYRRLALLLRRLGRNEEAGAAYREWQRHAPDDPVAAHMASALLGEAPPDRASPEYVRREFDGFADRFEDVLAKLEYRAPQLVAEALGRHGLAGRTGLDVLDAGCGTGLCAEFLRPLARRLVGVDLSGRMLAIAASRATYDELIEAELIAWLDGTDARFDLIVAADVFIYFGALDPLAESLARVLRPGGTIVFTIESADEDDATYGLNAGGRYAHGPRHVETVFARSGFGVSESSPVQLRQELGVGVGGRLIVAQLRSPG
jgi:predicted TPR repeat methyltransferase